MKHLLLPNTPFPDPHSADEDGLLAIGGLVTPARVFDAHCRGIFPWYENDALPLWWCPAQRGVLPCDAVHCSRRLARRMRQLSFTFSMDRHFADVIEACQNSHGETWITEGMRQVYCALHDQGRAHSFELRDENATLVGGLYGVALDRVFCGESMFSRIPDASKIVLVLMGQKLSELGFSYIDCQFVTAHLRTMGAHEISRRDYLALLGGDADRLRGHWSRFDSNQ